MTVMKKKKSQIVVMTLKSNDNDETLIKVVVMK